MELSNLIDTLLQSGEVTSEQFASFYKCFGVYQAKNKQDEKYLHDTIFLKIEKLVTRNILRQDLLYLSALASNNVYLVKEITKHERNIYTFDIEDSSSLYTYCIFENKHWIKEVLKNSQLYLKKFDATIYNKLLLLKIIIRTQSNNINVEDICSILESIEEDTFEDFWKYFIKEMRRTVNVTNFCGKLSAQSKCEIFNYSVDHCILDVLDKFVSFKKADFDDLLEAIKEDEAFYSEPSVQSQIFLGFIILSSILQILILGNDDKNTMVINVVQNITEKLLNIKNGKYQLELLENIFALMFLKNTHLSQNLQEEEFICSEKEVRLILYLLRSIIEEIKIKNLYEKHSEEYVRFNHLCKCISDAAWRMELIVNVKSSEKCERNFLKYMLAQPESLIQMCLKKGDFERGYQVIRIFNLQSTPLAEQIKYTEKLDDLKDILKKAYKIKSIKKDNPKIAWTNIESSIIKILKEFFTKNPCSSENIFKNIFDLVLTQPTDVDDCDTILQLAKEQNIQQCFVFYEKIQNIYKEVKTERQLPISEILNDARLYLDLNKYKREEELYRSLKQSYREFIETLSADEPGVLDENHKSHRALLRLNKICKKYTEITTANENINYLSKLFNYLKAFSRVLYIEQNTSNIVSCGKNTSYFELLHHNRSELMGKILFEKNLDPSEFEKYFGRLKLDYLYHVIGNCFPTINLHTKEHVTKDELYPENNLYVPSKGIISYIQKRNWLLAFILNEMYSVEDVKVDVGELRVKTFLNCLKLSSVQSLKGLFNNNLITTVLQNDISTQKVSDFINNKILFNDTFLTSSHHSHASCDSLETGEEILEDALKSTNWKGLFDIVDSIPENQLKKNSDLVELRDMVLTNLVQDGFEIGFYKYVEFIVNDDLRVTTILKNFRKWPGDFCEYVIKSEITRFDGTTGRQMAELSEWLQEIEMCENLKPILMVSTWSESYDICTKRQPHVISKLLSEDRIELLLKFIELHEPAQTALLEINEPYFLMIFETCNDFSNIKMLLDTLPYDHAIKICRNLLKLLKKLPQLQFVIEYLLNNENDDNLRYIEISLKILSVFTAQEQEQLLCLLHEPLSIVEILIMNTKLDKLASVLEILKREIDRIDFDEDYLSIEKVDQLLRKYAEKSLDFRVITQPDPRLLRTPEIKLMQSLDSLNLGSESRNFVMPPEVPTKDEWVQNNDVLECMCCQKVTFSMFNRRHHCRRCGRVVCYNCSMKRMLVESYGDILVRVCSDCFQQTHGEAMSDAPDTVSTKSILYDYWILTDDPEHNIIVRDEFSYEHAPSVSLCLSILKYHSKCVEYPKFLLDQCNIMLRLLLPSQEPIQEIDYLLVIKMLKSLATAAKMSSVECTLQYGTSLADRILSQSELLGLLAERGCLNMLPIAAPHDQGPFINASILRRLRDKLLEREQWNLALEVSTKTGLDNIGIFAAWGKSCLKAGSLSLAREKFQRCLDKTSYYETLSDSTVQSEQDEADISRSRYPSKYSNNSSYLEGKPSKNPPLLNEIIQILESRSGSISTGVTDMMQMRNLSSSMSSLNTSCIVTTQQDVALCILNKLRSIKEISAGNYFPHNKQHYQNTKPKMDPIFYEECIYYLTKYGTHISLLEFYVRHDEIHTALNYIIEYRLCADVFIEIYMKCLKDGIVNVLQDEMTKIDSTLDIWKEYLRQICRHLEKQNMLNSLYQLQLYMGDYIRAAMTCIRFYQENVSNFTDFATKTNFLHKAEEHLKQVLEQEQWVEVASVRTTSSKDSFEEKGLTNPSLVMKINSKDIDKHINTIWRQCEIVKFLAECEEFYSKPVDLLSSILITEETSKRGNKIPTLFGTTNEKIVLAVLAIISGRNVDDGFDIALRIIQEFKLKPVKVYCEAGKQLAKAERQSGIAQLVSCIKASGTNDNAVTDMCDEMLTLAVATFTKANVTGTKVEDLIKLISDRSTKISAYIEAKQLKTAYYLAVKYKRMTDIRRILREAELLNQPSIKALCLKVLQTHSHAPSHTKE